MLRAESRLLKDIDPVQRASGEEIGLSLSMLRVCLKQVEEVKVWRSVE